MIVLKISDLTYFYSDKILFDNVSFSLTSGQKVALVGQNGSGKSTLLDLIWGSVESRENTPSASRPPLTRGISLTGNVEYIAQNLGLRPAFTVLEYLMEQSLDWLEVWQILETRFGFENGLEVKLFDLSHGEYLKLKLAISICKNHDLLLLDEPTNNLDYDSILELGQILKGYKGAVLVVSHDPAFLDLFVTQVLELLYGKVESFGGNYEFYSQQKKLQVERQNELYTLAKRELKQALKSQQEAQINAQHRLIKGKKDATKSNLGKAEQNFFKNKSEVKSGQNKNKFDRIIASKEDELALNMPNINYHIHFKFNNNQIKNKRLLQIIRGELSVGGKVLIGDINFEVYSGQKVLIQGKNGSGKSSFLRGILGLDESGISLESVKISHFVRNDMCGKADKILKQVQDDTGDTIVAAIKDRHEHEHESFYFSDELKIVYLDQNYSLVNQNLNLEQNLKLANPEIDLTDLYKLLAYFQFSKDDGTRITNTLSGGELVRLNLAVLTLKKVDILILDEPTNNLDISTLEVLLKVIKEFQGALILVCHNAWFCDQIEFEMIYKIENFGMVVDKTSN